MKRILVALGALGIAAVPSFATTNYAFLDSRAANPNTVSYNGSSYDVSPYSGAFGTSSTEGQDSAAKLFCDDFVDHASYNSSWTANITTIAGLNSTTLAQTRYGSAVGTTGVTGYSYPTGTTLYQEIAWLFTQAVNPSTNSDNTNVIQEAVWKLTGAANSTPNQTYSDANPISGAANGWIELAAADYNRTVTGYLTPDYNKWYVITDVAAAGHVTGGTQEFLAYKTGTGGLPVAAVGTPEPATFALAGLALLGLGFTRRKKVQQ